MSSETTCASGMLAAKYPIAEACCLPWKLAAMMIVSAGSVIASTLGKIDVQGPDAAAFLDFVYTNTFSTLKPSRSTRP